METREIILNGTKFTLGQKYRDKLLGNEGMAMSGATYLTGCDQLQLCWNDSTGRPCAEWIDVSRIEAVEIKEQKRGGPGPNMPHRAPAGRL